VVASNSEIEALDSARLKDIFLRHRNFEGSVRVVPVNLLGEESARIVFEERVLMMVAMKSTGSGLQAISRACALRRRRLRCSR